ncbi:MAG: class I SAM-dependent methyltransferase [Planctomycetota bacterium]
MTQGFVEVTRCQVCGGANPTLEFEEAPYRVLRCPSCKMVWVSPRWSDDAIHAVYEEEYWKSGSPKTKGYANYAEESALYLKTFRRRMRFIERHVPKGGRILDVGCAAGYFLRIAQEYGHDVQGVEVSTAISKEAIRALGADRVWVGTLQSLPEQRPGCARGSFDLLTMWDVIEHVPDPQDLLREARRMLRPDGRLIVETQNIDSRFARLLGRRWHHFKHEEHIYHFNAGTIRRVLEDSGFEIESMTSSYAGKYVSFSFIAERASRLNKVVSFLLKPLALLRRANVYLNFHDELVVVAKPRPGAGAA